MSDIVELLNNDIKVLALHRRREARPGLWILSFPGDYMPSTYDFEWQYRGDLSQKVLLEFCQQVRDEYARQASDEIETPIEDTPRDAGGERDDPDAGVAGGGSIPAPTIVQDVEGSLEGLLEAQVDGLRSRARSLDDEIRRLSDAYYGILDQLERAERALGAYNEEPDTTALEETSVGPGSPAGVSPSEGPADHADVGYHRGEGPADNGASGGLREAT